MLILSPVLSVILIPTLILNFYVSLMLRLLLAKLAFKSGPLLRNPVNAMIMIDENIKLAALLGQSVIAFYFVQGVRVHQVLILFALFILCHSQMKYRFTISIFTSLILHLGHWHGWLRGSVLKFDRSYWRQLLRRSVNSFDETVLHQVYSGMY